MPSWGNPISLAIKIQGYRLATCPGSRKKLDVPVKEPSGRTLSTLHACTGCPGTQKLKAPQGGFSSLLCCDSLFHLNCSLSQESKSNAFFHLQISYLRILMDVLKHHKNKWEKIYPCHPNLSLFLFFSFSFFSFFFFFARQRIPLRYCEQLTQKGK